MSKIHQVKKRDGRIVDFDQKKIKAAITKAFEAVYGGIDEEIIENITSGVVVDLEGKDKELKTVDELIPGVEEIQDLVEQEIIAAGFVDVARAYIIYRHEHAKLRQKSAEQQIGETTEKLVLDKLEVTNSKGRRQKFDQNKIRQAITEAAAEINFSSQTNSGAADSAQTTIDVDGLVSQIINDLYDGISTAEIAKALVLAARSWIERDPVYSDLAARLLHRQLYHEVFNGRISNRRNLDKLYRTAFATSLQRAVRIGKLDKRMLDFNLEKLARALVVERDNLLKYLGAQTLYDRYYIQDPETKERLETAQIMWMRVAMGLALNETEKEKWAIKFYEMMSTLRYVPSTPTLFHAGTAHPQLSSCYLNTVNDDLTHIFKVIGDNAQLSKWSGGIGTDWSYLRATGALIRGTGVESQGVIPFLKVSNDATNAINRSGRRRGAACVYLETWHYDIEDFLELRKNTGDDRRRTHDIDTANWIPDLFMKRVREDKEWTLFSPDEVNDLHDLYGQAFEKRYEEYERLARSGKLKLFKEVKAKDLWKRMLAMLFETGHPWITFKDPANVRSPQDHTGVIHSSNLCTEIILNTSAEETAVCNLGSVNLARHLKAKSEIRNHKSETNSKNPNFDIRYSDLRLYDLGVKQLAETVTVAMRMLDNVIDLNFYPTIEAKKSNLKHRPVGLGVMGLHDALFQMGINFDSEEMVRFSDQSMEMIAYFAYLASSKLAQERGRYKSYQGSKWDRGILPQDTIEILGRERGERIPIESGERFDWGKVRASIKKYGMRNSNCLAIAPTATISNIAGSIPTIEPIYKNIYVKANTSGDFIVINPYLITDLKELKLWNSLMLARIKYLDGSIQAIQEIPLRLREKYKEVFEIDPKWLIKAAAYRGRWIDQSQSLNIYFSGASGAELSKIYFYAWEMGLKTTYYLRTLAKSQVEKSTVDASAFGTTHKREIKNQISNIKIAAPSYQPLVTNPAELKLCRIDDPNCESCQ